MAKAKDPEQAYWEEDAERLNKMAKLAKASKVTIPVTQAPEEADVTEEEVPEEAPAETPPVAPTTESAQAAEASAPARKPGTPLFTMPKSRPGTTVRR